MAALILMAPQTVRTAEAKELPDYVIKQFGAPPQVPTGAISPDLKRAIKAALVDSVTQSTWGRDQELALSEISQSKDPRIVWIISDLLRFVTGAELNVTLAQTASKLLGKELTVQNSWGIVTDHLIAWDIPAPPNYLEYKRAIFTHIVPGWDKIFVEGDIDWRHVSWGGVLIDEARQRTPHG